MHVGFLSSDSRTAAVSGAYAVSFRSVRKDSVHMHNNHIHSSYISGGLHCRKKSRRKEIPLGACNGLHLFSDPYSRIPNREQRHGRCNEQPGNGISAVRRQRDAWGDGELEKGYLEFDDFVTWVCDLDEKYRHALYLVV